MGKEVFSHPYIIHSRAKNSDHQEMAKLRSPRNGSKEWPSRVLKFRTRTDEKRNNVR